MPDDRMHEPIIIAGLLLMHDELLQSNAAAWP